MSDNPRRRWFQFHLSTAVLVMFAAGGLISVNSVKHTRYVVAELECFDGPWSDSWGEMVNVERRTAQGWPFTIRYDAYSFVLGSKSLPSDVKEEQLQTFDIPKLAHSWSVQPRASPWRYDSLAYNCICGVLMLAGLAFVCEFIVRCQSGTGG
jgi:hypothetical protein